MEQKEPIRVLDLCAGTGWGVACHRLGLEEHGAEIMPEVIATRKLHGMATPYRDIRHIGEAELSAGRYLVQLGSPPCPKFSVAGKGRGRALLGDVIEGTLSVGRGGPIPYGGASDDVGVWLVLEPLRIALLGRPMFIAWEQVPPVLPIWEACATVLREHGYSVATGNLQAEQYGVPQTRKRAFLLARRDGAHAALPTPTHSRYHPRTPERLTPGVQPWVSMADALGWHGRDQWAYRSTTMANSALRSVKYPSPTIAFGHDAASARWVYCDRNTGSTVDRRAPGVRVTVEEAQVLQSYPEDFTFVGSKSKQYLQIGNAVPPLLAEAVLRELLGERVNLDQVVTLPA